MLLRAWPKLMQFDNGSEVAVLGIGPGMFLEGVCLRCYKTSEPSQEMKSTEKISITSVTDSASNF